VWAQTSEKADDFLMLDLEEEKLGM